MKSAVKCPIGPLLHEQNLVSNPSDMCELLKEQFESVFNFPSDTCNINNLTREHGPRGLDNIYFTEDDIKTSIMSIPTHSAPGPDGIPAKLLKECVNELKGPLYTLWRRSLDTGIVPEKLKFAHVVPCFKKGDRSSPKNYRPISLTSHVGKIFERILVKAITEYLNIANLFNPEQHGFRSGRSCLSQLLEHHQKILAALESGGNMDVVYLDFSKAFDKVDYAILLSKLRAIGFSGVILKWVHSFLVDRKQAINIEGSLSTVGPVTSGVPQGSSVGPLLFLIHIADIGACVENASVSSFADDTRVSMCTMVNEDCVKMQKDLQMIYDWAITNNMSFNTDKFEHLRYRINDEPIYPYSTPDGTHINEAGQVSDLGIIIENTATFQGQIVKATKRSNNMAGWVLRVFMTRGELPMMTLYRSMVLPHLEYCCQLWSPHLLGDIRKLESVQRSFTSRIAGLEHKSYWDRLLHLKLFSVERRRERYIVLYIYKIVQKFVPNFNDERFSIKTYLSVRGDRLCRVPAISRAPSGKIRTLIENSFAVQGPKLFNCLPAELRNIQGSILAFKASLDKFLLKVSDKPCTPGYHQPATSNSIINQLAQMRADGNFI